MTRFVWEGLRLLQEIPEYGLNKEKLYLYRDSGSYEPLARLDDNHQLYWYHTTPNGTPERLTDEAGEVRWQAVNNAWGKQIYQPMVTGGRVEQNLRMQGQYYDEESGLHYNLFRYYDPVARRFTQLDPIGLAGGINLYQYAPNALGWVDPLGLSADDLVRYKPNPGITAQPGARATAISRAWGQERELVAAGGGSRNWTSAERKIILETKNNRQLSSIMSEVGYTGHHINSVKNNGTLGAQWQGDPRNIVFLQNSNHPSGYDEHLLSNQGHRGKYENPGRGRLIDRIVTHKKIIKKCHQKI